MGGEGCLEVEGRRGRSGEERIWSSGEVMKERRRRKGMFIGERSGERCLEVVGVERE